MRHTLSGPILFSDLESKVCVLIQKTAPDIPQQNNNNNNNNKSCVKDLALTDKHHKCQDQE